MSEQKRYTLDEIDRMRAAVGNMFPMGVPYRQSERTVEIEARLRTYMANGTDPDELAAWAAAYVRRQFDYVSPIWERQRP